MADAGTLIAAIGIGWLAIGALYAAGLLRLAVGIVFVALLIHGGVAPWLLLLAAVWVVLDAERRGSFI
jgi:hypothetical protein